MSLQREPLQRLQLAEASQPGQCTAGRLSGSMQGPGRASQVLEATGPRSPKRLRVSDFPSRYRLVLPRSSSTPAPFSSSSEAESAHHHQSRQCQCKVTWCCFGLLPSLGVGSGGVGGRPSCLRAAPLQSQGPPLATKIRAYKAVIDSPCYYPAFIRS